MCLQCSVNLKNYSYCLNVTSFSWCQTEFVCNCENLKIKCCGHRLLWICFKTNILFFIMTCTLRSNPTWWLQSSLITLRKAWTLLTMKWSRRRELSSGWASVVVFVFCPGRGKSLIISVVTAAWMLWSRSVSSSSRSSRLSSILSRANQPVDEDGMWKLEDGTADSSKNHKNFNSGGPKGGRFVSK